MDTGLAVAVIGLALAWLLYRMERAATRRREIVAARAVLLGVKRGMVDGYADQSGWGDYYFTTNYTEELAEKHAAAAAESIMEGSFSQVFVVPRAVGGADRKP